MIYLSLFAVIASIYYIYYRLTFWKRQNVINEVASVYNRFTKPFHLADQLSYKKYGPIVGTYEGLRPSLMLSDLELIKKVLVEEFYKFPNHRLFYNESQLAGKSLVVLENEKWKRVRQIITPIFSTHHLKNMKPLIDECVSCLENNLEVVAKTGEAVNVKDYFSAFAIDVVCRSVFGVEIDSVNNPEHPLVKNLRRFFGRNISLKSLIVFWWPSLMKHFNLYLFDYEILVYLNSFLMNVIARKRQQINENESKRSDDFIQLLMDAKLEIDDCDASHRTLTTQEIADQGMLFIVAGFDTTSTTLTNIVYCLATNPNCQRRLYQEIESTVKKYGSKQSINYEVINEMKYLDAVIWEGIRYITAVPRIDRRAMDDCVLGDMFIPKDTIITIPCYALNHDERYFKNPEIFNPQRFLDDVHLKTRLPYLPFAVGPRNCIGMRFALLELKTCLVSIISKYEFIACKQTKIPLDFFRGQPVLTAVDVTLCVIQRENKVIQ